MTDVWIAVYFWICLLLEILVLELMSWEGVQGPAPGIHEGEARQVPERWHDPDIAPHEPNAGT